MLLLLTLLVRPPPAGVREPLMLPGRLGELATAAPMPVFGEFAGNHLSCNRDAEQHDQPGGSKDLRIIISVKRLPSIVAALRQNASVLAAPTFRCGAARCR